MSANNRLSSNFFGSLPGNAWFKGIVFTFFIAFLGYLLALVPGFNFIGQLACAIIIAVAYRQLFGYPESLRSGIAFSSKRLLRAAIILYGLKLNVHIILEDGLGLLARDAAVVLVAIFGILLLAKLFKADRNISLLLGVGTGICGAAAIAAVAPIIKAKDEDTAIGVGIIALMGTVFAIAYTILRPFLPIGDIEYGMWAGMSLHEVAHVALAGAPAGEEGLAMALLAKLGRVFLLIPVCFIFIWIMKRKAPAGDVSSKVEFPWFLLGFMGMSLIGSYVLGPIIPVSEAAMDFISILTTWLLTAAMVGLGLNVSLKDVKERALLPLAVMTIVSLSISILTFFTL
ncbi:putative sulfate exporter family transporter [Planococcus maritimus]|uniref:Putative sulfate exporter family transporter n=1 Tax=Planococcus maritimus TaxID=192421 RepID=A0A7D7MB68_PLAMR|nr:putative sulfate exporter family transporter [Planococcus maritimus]QMT17312.1 putative sulfate exporter family transporter [Planococcus maritimus]